MKGNAANRNVRVAVRVRPALDREVHAGNTFNNMKVSQEQKLVK